MIKFNKEEIFIVTGASSGIGEKTALLLNELGASVVAVARNEERLNALKTKCKFPNNLHIEIKDLVEDIEGLPDYVKELRDKYGQFSGMAYCAGISELAPLQIVEIEKTKKMFDINYFAPIFMIKGFADKKNNTGDRSSIVVISSISGLISDKGHTSYSGSKAAIAASCKCIARELANSNVRVNCVSPSDVKTPLTAHKIKTENSKYPFGCGEAEDVANMIIFLLSKKSKWITTQNFVIDCGYM